jgi:hypothetical protein
VWLALWFLVVLKLPILYLAYVIWWSVKDPPEAWAEGAGESGATGGLGRPPAGPRPRRGPERKPVRKHVRTSSVLPRAVR